MVSVSQSDQAGRFPKLSAFDHLFIIRGLALREVKIQHIKSGSLGFWAELIMPIFVMVIHYYIFLALGRRMPARMPCELFVLGGFPVWFTFRNTMAPAIRASQETQGTIFIPGVTPFHFLAAAAFWEGTMMAFVMYSGLLFSEWIIGGEPLPQVPITFLIFALSALLGCGYGLVFDTLGWIWPMAKNIKKPLSWLLFLTSGVYVAAQSNNEAFAKISWFNPLIHLIESQRRALYAGYPVARVSLAYAAAWSFGLVLVGLLMYRLLGKFAK